MADGGHAGGDAGDPLAARVIALLIERGQTVAVAESLTGGLVTATLTTVPGSSAVVRGGVVAYAPEVKSSVLGVPADLLDRCGTVHADVAAAMARGVAARLGATAGLATTGVAGPDPAEGHPVGTVHVAACVGEELRHRELALAGGREQIRRQSVENVLGLLAELLTETPAD